MATNCIFAPDTRVNFVYEVPEGTVAGDFVMVGEDANIPGVAETSRGDAVRTEVLGNLGITVTYPGGGASLGPTQATVATTGTWDLPVTGAGDETGNGVAVYIVDNALTLTGTETDTVFGITNYPAEGYARRDGIAPVRIGAPN